MDWMSHTVFKEAESMVESNHKKKKPSPKTRLKVLLYGDFNAY